MNDITINNIKTFCITLYKRPTVQTVTFGTLLMLVVVLLVLVQLFIST